MMCSVCPGSLWRVGNGVDRGDCSTSPVSLSMYANLGPRTPRWSEMGVGFQVHMVDLVASGREGRPRWDGLSGSVLGPWPPPAPHLGCVSVGGMRRGETPGPPESLG